MLRIALTLMTFAIGSAHEISAQDLTVFSIGTGDIDGGYYATAKSLCDPINVASDRRLRCSPEPTSGSIYNLTMLENGELDFAFAQSDWQLAALRGTGPFAGRPMADLRSVMSLYPETITILVGRNSGIYSPKDLPGKKIDIGLPSSGRHATALGILERSGMDSSLYGTFAELTQEQAIDGLCDESIDATLLVIGHPSTVVARALSECGARILAPNGPGFQRALANTPDFVGSTIAAGTYPELLQDVESYAVYATLVTRADVAPAIVNAMVWTTLSRLELLSSVEPRLSGLTIDNMRTKGLTAPMHDEATLAIDQFALSSAKN